jgi:DNA-binding transcriptional LysR family regulator
MGRRKVPVEMRHLRYVVATSQSGSFRRAAASLGIDQSAICRRIRDLEDDIGAALFIRHSGGIILTQAGVKFVRHARQALHQISLAVDVGPFGRGEEGVVRIGILSSLASGFLNQLLTAYCNRYTGVFVDIIEGLPSDHIADVRQHKLDVAFVTGPQSLGDCETAQFWSERVFVVLPVEHALASRASLGWDDLDGETFIVSGDAFLGPESYDFVIKRVTEFGITPIVERHRVGRDNLMQIVSLGRGVTLTSEATIATRFPGVTYCRLEGETLPFTAVWSPNNDNPALRRMLSLARSRSREIGMKTMQETKSERHSAVGWAPSSLQSPA